jgi:CubicO group peptidase (beta-lactamase class C family)
MERLRVPGVAVGLLDGGEEHVAGYGVTSVEHPQPVDGDTLFQIGSISKTVTGTAAARLVEMGKLDFDAPVRSYMPDLRLADETAAARVTLRHLFTHTGGWVGDYFDDLGSGDDALAKIVARLADLPQLTPLGTVWSYNNAGFYLAGRVIEVAAGQTFEATVQTLVFDPLGMKRSCFSAADAITHRVAVGHHVWEGAPTVARPWGLARTANPVGGINSSVRDMLRYARFHLSDGVAPDGGRLLTPASMRLMQSPQAPAEWDDAWGLTWGLRAVGGMRVVRHGGSTNGQQASLVLVPERQFALVVLTNADSGSLLHEEVALWTLRQFLGLQEPEPQPADVPADVLASYAGTYVGALADVVLIFQDGGLMLKPIPKGGFPLKDSPPPPAPPPMHIAAVGRDRIVVQDGPMKGRRGEFLRRPDGSIAWLRSSRLHAKLP